MPLERPDMKPFSIAGQVLASRVGYGCLRLQEGEGEPGLRLGSDETVQFLRDARDLGYQLFDTADIYGDGENELALARAFGSDEDLIIATKGGFRRLGEDWVPDGTPEHLRRACEASLRRLGRDTIDLYQLHVIDPTVPVEESIGALYELRRKGLIRELGICNAEPDDFGRAVQVANISTVQNRVNPLYPPSERFLQDLTERQVWLLAWYPLEAGTLGRPRGQLARIAANAGCTAAQLTLSACLSMSPGVVIIPGTTNRTHLRENREAEFQIYDDEIVARYQDAIQRLRALREAAGSFAQ
jgi:aryl-alcohol dehydrogenase-like predicted oxidoreductase